MDTLLGGVLFLSVLFAGAYLLGCGITIIKIVIKLFKKLPIREEFRAFNPFGTFKNSKKAHESDVKYQFVFGMLTVIGILYLIIPMTALAPERIGAIFEKKSYTTFYYANMYPDISASRNYRVIAEVDADAGFYSVDRVFFLDNGEVLHLDYSNIDSLEFNVDVSVIDNKDRDWRIELVDVKPTDFELKRVVKE